MLNCSPFLLNYPAAAASVSFSPVSPSDKHIITEFHKAARVASDKSILPAYTYAAVDGGHYEAMWNKHFDEVAQGTACDVIKATIGGQIVGFVRFGAVPTPQEPELQAFGKEDWAELHQLYLDPSAQRRGIGSALFHMAETQLAAQGHKNILINVLQENHNARSFYHQKGAVLAAEVVEHNQRNGMIFTVPCALYAKRLPALSFALS